MPEFMILSFFFICTFLLISPFMFYHSQSCWFSTTIIHVLINGMCWPCAPMVSSHSFHTACRGLVFVVLMSLFESVLIFMYPSRFIVHQRQSFPNYPLLLYLSELVCKPDSQKSVNLCCQNQWKCINSTEITYAWQGSKF